MDANRKTILELIVAIETKDPRLPRVVDRVKNNFNPNMQFKYEEMLRRANKKGEEATA